MRRKGVPEEGRIELKVGRGGRVVIPAGFREAMEGGKAIPWSRQSTATASFG